jgi:hypothetical protein
MEKKKLKVTHRFDKDYKLFSATDAILYINPRGYLVIHFFTDTHELPKTTIGDLREDGTLDEEKIIKNFGEGTEVKDIEKTVFLDRNIHDTVLLNPETAINVALIMLEKIAENPHVSFDKEKLKEKIDKIIEVDKKNEEGSKE